MMQADAKALSDLLAWYEAMGVDAGVGEEPVNAFAVGLPLGPKDKAGGKPPAARAMAGASQGRGLAGEAASLAELEALVAAFEGCALKRTAKSLCFARGSESRPHHADRRSPGPR